MDLARHGRSKPGTHTALQTIGDKLETGCYKV